MATWESVTAKLRETYPVDEAESDDGFLVLKLIGGDRHQTVLISHHEGEKYGEWIRIESPIGNLTPS